MNGAQASVEYQRRHGIEPHIYDDPPDPWFFVLLDVADGDPVKARALRRSPMLFTLAALDRKIADRRARAKAGLPI